MFGFILTLWLFLCYKYIVLFNPSADLDNTILQFSVIAAFIWRLREANRCNVFLSLNFRFNKCVIHTIE